MTDPQTPATEAGREPLRARLLAERILDRWHGDPDDDLAILARAVVRLEDAAEAAPLDVERLARAMTEAVPLRVGIYAEAEAIAREYAVLRSPDSEGDGPASDDDIERWYAAFEKVSGLEASTFEGRAQIYWRFVAAEGRPTDPALRALLHQKADLLSRDDDRTFTHQMVRLSEVHEIIDEALAAAEAAPLDVERLARAIEKVLPAEDEGIVFKADYTAIDIAREYAALREQGS